MTRVFFHTCLISKMPALFRIHLFSLLVWSSLVFCFVFFKYMLTIMFCLHNFPPFSFLFNFLLAFLFKSHIPSNHWSLTMQGLRLPSRLCFVTKQCGCFCKAYRFTGSSEGLKQSSNAYIELFHHWLHPLWKPPLAFVMTRCAFWNSATWLEHLGRDIPRATMIQPRRKWFFCKSGAHRWSTVREKKHKQHTMHSCLLNNTAQEIVVGNVTGQRSPVNDGRAPRGGGGFTRERRCFSFCVLMLLKTGLSLSFLN